MTNRDFVDADLLKPRVEPGTVRVEPTGTPRRPSGEAGAGTRPVSDLDLPAIARHKQQLDANSQVTSEELEKLRRKEEELQRRKRELEDARRKHEDFLKGKQELAARLSQSLVGIERQEIRAGQVAQLLQSTRQRFRELLETVQGLHEDRWSEDEVPERLNEALATIDDARMEFNKATARVEALVGAETEDGAGPRPSFLAENEDARDTGERGFLDWFRIGLAVSLPVVLALVALAVVIVLYAAGLL